MKFIVAFTLFLTAALAAPAADAADVSANRLQARRCPGGHLCIDGFCYYQVCGDNGFCNSFNSGIRC